MKGFLCFTLLVTALALVLPGTALAQTGAIAGEVADESGGVLPGVTVTATSPTAIDVRTTVTDGQGLYTLPALVPGTYVVEYSLPGFSVVRREGVDLSAGFTANIDAVLAVGGLEETVTVTGATPTVDIQNVNTQQVLESEVLKLLPQAGSLSAFTALTLGLRVGGAGMQDVGGSSGEMGSVSVHNNRSTDQRISMEGMNTNNAMGSNGGAFHAGQHYNMEAVAEVTLAHSGMSAETETAGLNMNYIPKDGGNQFSATGRATFTNSDFQSDNLSTDLAARGVTTAPSIRKIWDYGASLGGPIVQDRLWFFTAHRWWGNQTNSPGAFHNGSQGQTGLFGQPIYTADMNAETFTENFNQDNSVRFTWQASDLNKITYYGNHGDQCVCNLFASSVLTPRASVDNGLFNNHLSQFTFTRAHSNSILIEGGFSWLKNPFTFPHGGEGEEVSLTDIPVTEFSPYRFYNASTGFGGALPYNDIVGGPSPADQLNARGSVSYVTGSHNLKFGMNWSHGWVEQNGALNELAGFGPLSYTLFQGFPIGITLYNTPKFNRVDFRNMGLYAQDQWTLDRLTFNLGVRADFFNGWSPQQQSPATAYLPALSFARIEDTPTWKDVSPRLGVAWDVTGDGKTAVKVMGGRYMAAAGAGIVQANNPSVVISRSTNRTWADADGDFFPDGVPSNPVANGELGPSDNPAFGSPVVTTFYDPNVLTSNRQYTWQFSAGVDRELRDNVSVSATYFRTQHYNQTITDNENRVRGDYEEYSVTVPAGLTGAGTVVSGFFNPTFAAQAIAPRNVVKNAKDFGVNQSETYDGVDFEVNARFANGALIQGGYSLGRIVDDDCFVVDSPQNLVNCRDVLGVKGTQQIKFSGSYPLPYGVSLSAVLQNLPGLTIQANTQFTNAQVAPSLGRNLSTCPAPTGACTATVTLPLLEPNADYEGRLTQLDFRVAKDFAGDFGRVRVMLDLYNAFNTSPVLQRNNTFSLGGGGSWGLPTQFLNGRLVKIGTQFSWN